MAQQQVSAATLGKRTRVTEVVVLLGTLPDSAAPAAVPEWLALKVPTVAQNARLRAQVTQQGEKLLLVGCGEMLTKRSCSEDTAGRKRRPSSSRQDAEQACMRTDGLCTAS